jgi:hypothetical protein
MCGSLLYRDAETTDATCRSASSELHNTTVCKIFTYKWHSVQAVRMHQTVYVKDFRELFDRPSYIMDLLIIHYFVCCCHLGADIAYSSITVR